MICNPSVLSNTISELQEIIGMIAAPVKTADLADCEIKLIKGRKYTVIEQGHPADGYTGTLECYNVDTKMAVLSMSPTYSKDFESVCYYNLKLLPEN